MKKLIFLLVLLLAIPLAIFGQDVPTQPTNWGDIVMNPQKWFVDFGAVTVLTAFLATFANGLFKVTAKFPRQLVAWGIAIILLVGSDLLNFGYAKDFPILLALIHGFGAGLGSNGVYNIPWIKGALDAIEGLFKPKPVVP